MAVYTVKFEHGNYLISLTATKYRLAATARLTAQVCLCFGILLL